MYKLINSEDNPEVAVARVESIQTHTGKCFDLAYMADSNVIGIQRTDGPALLKKIEDWKKLTAPTRSWKERGLELRKVKKTPKQDEDEEEYPWWLHIPYSPEFLPPPPKPRAGKKYKKETRKVGAKPPK